MGMTSFYGDFNRAEQEGESLQTIAKALELGINFLDTAWIYQSFGQGGGENTSNEELIGKAISIHGREKFIIATKFGVSPSAEGLKVCNKPEFIRSQLEESLKRLGTDHIDLYYAHRIDPDTPIEEMMFCLKSLVREGKIKYVGLSECTASELRRAHVIQPVSAIQMEWSLQTRDIESNIVPTARELGVGIVPYSPLGRGLLSATFTSPDQLPENDWRRVGCPRFSPENIEKNSVSKFIQIAERKGCTPAQLALAWVLSRGADVVPIPGTKSPKRLEENAKAVTVTLTEEEIREIEASVPTPVGDRYSDGSSTYQVRV
jgi:aryl-alcohol dehydrogenase-like predicted oxidoreductase